ncbi:MAG: ferrous iron transport protein A [Dehalococcoidia bacterium]|nr:ferrous iron transport protein A [Dehalococcoidia bacterium]
MNDGVVPLSQLAHGDRGTVHQLQLEAAVIGRLASLGFSLGTNVGMLQNRGNGPLIVKVRHSRIALERRLASSVLVARARRPANEPPED